MKKIFFSCGKIFFTSKTESPVYGAAASEAASHGNIRDYIFSLILTFDIKPANSTITSENTADLSKPGTPA